MGTFSKAIGSIQESINVGHVSRSSTAGLLRTEEQGSLADHHLADAVSIEAKLLGDDRTEPSDLEIIRVESDPAIAARGLSSRLELIAGLHDGHNSHL